jgi:hypothetical protein
MKNDTQIARNIETLIDLTDFEMLKTQKKVLINLIDEFQTAAKNWEGKSKIKSLAFQGKADALTGILNLIDSVQDFAVDVMHKDEKEVFDFSEED